jgi:hypothetical protein
LSPKPQHLAPALTLPGGVDKHTNALSVAVSGDGDTLEVNFGSDCSESFTASFLRAYAPIVGKAVDGEQPVYFTRNPLSAQHDDKLWDSTLDLPTFQYRCTPSLTRTASVL